MFQSFLPLENENKNLCSARCNSVYSSRLFLVRNVDRAGFVFIIDVNLLSANWKISGVFKDDNNSTYDDEWWSVAKYTLWGYL